MVGRINPWCVRLVDNKLFYINAAYHPEWRGFGLRKRQVEERVDYCFTLGRDTFVLVRK